MPAASQGKKRLLFVSNLFPDREEPVRGLDNATLLRTLSRDWNIRVIVPRPVFPPWKKAPAAGREADRRFEPVYVPSPYLPKVGDRWNDRLMTRALASSFATIAADFRPEVILGSWLYPDGCATADLAGRHALPAVLITQGTDTHHYLDYPIRRRKIRSAIEGSEAVICRSGDLARRLEGAGADPEKLRVIYNGVDTEIFRRRDRRTVRRELDLDPDEPVLLFVGNFLPVKDPLFLIRAHAELNRRRAGAGGKPVRLVMIGDGPLRKTMETEIENLGSRSRVDLGSRMPPESIARWMNAADLLCLSSKNEGFPNVILEALAVGLPVVSTDVGGIRERIDDPALGQLVPPGNRDLYTAALETGLAGGDSSRSTRAGAATDAPPDESWARAARDYHAVLESAISNAATR